ncbi:maltose O-acetyltransferase [Bacillus sp. OV194]|nr:maltose O-acetyltransferase [Bacillus sp. OV194]
MIRIINKFRLVVCLSIINVLAPTRFYKLKSLLLKGIGIKCGTNVRIGGKLHILSNNITFGSNIWIGDNCRIYNSPPSKVIIESNVDIAPNCTICTGTHEIGDENQRAGLGKLGNIVIGKGTWIAINSVIIAGVSIGKGNILAAGSVVTRDSSNNVMLGGVPAKKIKDLK